jgi:hypothetical protein
MNATANIIDLLTAATNFPTAQSALENTDLTQMLNQLKEFATDLAEVVPPEDTAAFSDAATTLGAAKLLGVLRDFDHRLLTQRMQQKPELFFTLIHALADLIRAYAARAHPRRD